jgi:hypothetical protein
MEEEQGEKKQSYAASTPMDELTRLVQPFPASL